jgi:hypothetical protein
MGEFMRKKIYRNTQKKTANVQGRLSADSILKSEFTYAKETAFQAMEDRHKMVNYYLIIIGILINAVIGLFKEGLRLSDDVQESIVFSLLFIAFVIGVLYLLKLIRLRFAWLDSAQAMNEIKDYYDRNLSEYKLKETAFRWDYESLAKFKMNKANTLFFLSALLIIFIDSAALLAGMLFIGVHIIISIPSFLLLFFVQIFIYRSQLNLVVINESRYKK